MAVISAARLVSIAQSLAKVALLFQGSFSQSALRGGKEVRARQYYSALFMEAEPAEHELARGAKMLQPAKLSGSVMAPRCGSQNMTLDIANSGASSQRRA